MTLSKEQIDAIVAEEVARWREAHSALVRAAHKTGDDMLENRATARQLTAELVGSKRAEDKAQLASDEAVAHGLSKLRRRLTGDYETLAKQPYFARVVTDEDGKEIEFYLGTSSFPKQRIVDWRKAPISQLYYNYKQGDEFDEIVQGRERSGIIKIRRGYKGENDQLKAIELPEGIIREDDGKWIFEANEAVLSRSAGHDGHLPPILSLITREQFRLISHEANKPVIIQGVAGSGKTTVALHRLAWLLHADNSDAAPLRSMVVVFNRALKAYIETTLPELGIEGVPIRTYHQWLGNIAREFGGGQPYSDFEKTQESEQFKSSPICLSEINEYVMKFPETPEGGFATDLFRFYDYLSKRQIFWPRWEAIAKGLQRQASSRLRDQQDDSVLLNLIFAREGHYPCKLKGSLSRCDHIVIDEVQDFGVMEIRALLGALDTDRTVTIVGDTAQKIVTNRHFGSWEELLREAGFADTTPITLSVSHRASEEIMKLARHIRGGAEDCDAAPMTVRHGPEPLLIKADTYENEPYLIGRWIEEKVAENPHSLSAVICRLPKQAENLAAKLRAIGYPFVRWGYRENFDFSPGVVVTNVHQVKGLEFRNVLVVNPTENQYSARKEDEKNLLYVAATRAQVTLDFITRDNQTQLLPKMLKWHMKVPEIESQDENFMAFQPGCDGDAEEMENQTD